MILNKSSRHTTGKVGTQSGMTKVLKNNSDVRESERRWKAAEGVTAIYVLLWLKHISTSTHHDCSTRLHNKKKSRPCFWYAEGRRVHWRWYRRETVPESAEKGNEKSSCARRLSRRSMCGTSGGRDSREEINLLPQEQQRHQDITFELPW